MNIDKTCTLIWEGIENVMSSVLLLTMRMLDVGKEKSRRFLEKKKEEKKRQPGFAPVIVLIDHFREIEGERD